MKLDDSKILFVIHKQNAEHYELCLQSIQDMKIPQDDLHKVYSLYFDFVFLVYTFGSSRLIQHLVQ